MTDETAEALVDLAFDESLRELPDRTTHAAKRLLIDSLGCAVGGVDQPEVKALRTYALGSPGPVTLWGTLEPTSLDVAALVNGVMTRCLDFNDDYFGGSGDMGPHPSDVIGALGAAVESAGGGGKDLLEAIVLAYEAIARIIDVLRAESGRAWDYTFVHAVGTVLGARRALGLDRQQLRHALGIAVVSSVGLYQARTGELSNWKAFAGPHASRNGLVAAQLSAAGITGPAEPFTGRGGLAKLLGQDLRISSQPLSDRSKIEDAHFKSLPVRYTNQLALGIAIEAHPEVDLAALDTVLVYGIGRDVVRRSDRPELWQPDSRETADHSLPYLVAAALVDGSVDSTTFERERYTDPVILGVANRIALEEDPRYSAAFPADQWSRIEVTYVGGRQQVFERTNPKGHPRNPMTDVEIEAKLAGLVGDRIPADRRSQLLDRLWAVEREPSLPALWALTRVTGGAPPDRLADDASQVSGRR